MTRYQLEAVFEALCQVLEEADLCLHTLFLKAGKAFDVNVLCRTWLRRDMEANIPRTRRSADWQTDDTPFDPELYRRRLVSEQLNAWLDGFKTLLVRFATYLYTWLAIHWLAFAVLLLRRIGRTLTA